MRIVRIGTASISPTVGDFRGNVSRIRSAVDAARERGVHLLVLPELALSGYSLEDRISWPVVAEQSWRELEALAPACAGVTTFVGLPVRMGGLMYNAAALIHEGRVRGLIFKRYLPAYSIFYEIRNWTPWAGGVTEAHGLPAGDLVFSLPFCKVSAEICEDLFAAQSPALARVQHGAEIICNPSASPFLPRKNEERKRRIVNSADNLRTVYAYANLLGCDSSRLVFDGGGVVAAPGGIVSEAPILSTRQWTLADGVVDLDDLVRLRGESTTWRMDATETRTAAHVETIDATEGAFIPAPLDSLVAAMPRSFYVGTAPPARDERSAALDELFDALALGLRDYFEKVGVFKKILIALSGGRDSALCLLLAVAAAKALNEGRDAARYAERIETVYLPHDGHSTTGTENAARALAKEMGVPYRVQAIGDEARRALAVSAALCGGEENVRPIARENMQARIRGALMLNWANSVDGLVLVTSNLSEAGVGYSTTGGDNEGGYSPIANLPKTLITEMLEYLSERDGIRAIQLVLSMPPSAELAPGQEDEKDLMPYPVLDDLLYLYGEKRLSLAECWQVVCLRHRDYDCEQLRTWTADFGKRFFANQWKRDQHPVSLKVLELDLDPKTGFRFPVTQSVAFELEALQAAEAPPRA